MSLVKNPKYDLKRKYARYIEVGLILSLALMIAAFKYLPDPGTKAEFKEGTQGLMTAIEVPVTIHDVPKPRPEVPKIPVEAPDDSDFIDEDIPIVEFNDPVNNTPPRRYEEKDDDEEEEDGPIIFRPVEKQPEPIGGIAGIQARIKYPPMAIKAGIQGRVIIIASVTKEGKVVKVEVGRGIGGGCEEEAMRVVMETTFSPGEQRARPVATKVAIPVLFKLR